MNIFKIGLLIIILGGPTLAETHAPSTQDRTNIVYHLNYSDHNSKRTYKTSQEFNIPFDNSINTATLKFDAAAGNFYLSDTTQNLLFLRQSGNRQPYKYFTEQNGTRTKIDIWDRKGHVIFFKSKHREVTLKLNSKPVWDINLNAGASQLNFDLSQFKVRSLNLDGGAGSFDITLGNLFPDTKMTLDVGASSITIRVPKSSGCDLQLSSALSHKNLKEFQKTGDGHYQTRNFNSAKNKVRLNINAAVSRLNIIRY